MDQTQGAHRAPESPMDMTNQPQSRKIGDGTIIKLIGTRIYYGIDDSEYGDGFYEYPHQTGAKTAFDRVVFHLDHEHPPADKLWVTHDGVGGKRGNDWERQEYWTVGVRHASPKAMQVQVLEHLKNPTDTSDTVVLASDGTVSVFHTRHGFADKTSAIQAAIAHSKTQSQQARLRLRTLRSNQKQLEAML